MGTTGSTPKIKITKPSKKCKAQQYNLLYLLAKNGVAPISLPNLNDNVSSPSEHCKSAKTKSSTCIQFK